VCRAELTAVEQLLVAGPVGSHAFTRDADCDRWADYRHNEQRGAGQPSAGDHRRLFQRPEKQLW